MEKKLFVAQRVSAMILAPLVLIHLGLILVAVNGGLTGAEILGRTQGSFLWAVFYGLFVLVAAIHAPIGLRNIMNEWTSVSSRIVNGFCCGFALFLGGIGFYAVSAVI